MSKKKPLTPAVVAWRVLLFLVLLVALFFAGGLIFMAVWNGGVTGVVAACGGHASNIGFSTAVWANLIPLTMGLRSVRTSSDS